MSKSLRISLRALLLTMLFICVALAGQRYRVARWVQAERKLTHMNSCWLTYDNGYSTSQSDFYPMEFPVNGRFSGFLGDCTAARVVSVMLVADRLEETLPSLICLPGLTTVVLVHGGQTPLAELQRLETLLRQKLPDIKVEIQLAVVG